MTRASTSVVSMFPIRPQTADDTGAIEALHAAAFGPGRFTRTAYRIREASTCGPLIALTAWQGGELAGAIHFTAITIGGRRGALLLGPLAIAPQHRNKGCGSRLIRAGVEEGVQRGYALVVLVGDMPYYQREGFRIVPAGQILLPGPADPNRLLARELVSGALAKFAGLVAADNETPFEAATRPEFNSDLGIGM